MDSIRCQLLGDPWETDSTARKDRPFLLHGQSSGLGLQLALSLSGSLVQVGILSRESQASLHSLFIGPACFLE